MRPHFSTTLDVIQRVMGVPKAAVQAIARNAGIDDEKQVGACIDENALSYFADAYVRKVKTYFNSCTRHLNELSYAEQIQFNLFYNQFKKASSSGSIRKWEDIDEDTLRAHFEQEVKDKTSKEKPNKVTSLVDLFSGAGGLFQIDKIAENVLRDLSNEDDNVVVERPRYRRKYIAQSDLQLAIIYSRWVRRKQKKRIRSQICDHSPIWLLPARYYVFSGDDNDHIENTVLQVNGHIGDPLYNSIPRMAA